MRCANSSATTAAVPRVSQWRVRVPKIARGRLDHLVDWHLHTLPTPGDVSLSAEDKPPDYLIYRPPAVQLQQVPSMDHDRTPSSSENDDVDDNDDDDDDGLLQEHHNIEDSRHSWLGGMTALKFLVAGGVAGAGQLHPTIADLI